MNPEYLLNAIGQLDDDLVQEAENYRRPKARYGRLLGLAASFVVVILLGYGVTRIGGMGNGGTPAILSGGGNGAVPTDGGGMDQQQTNDGIVPPSAPAGGGTGKVFEPDVPVEAVPSSQGGSWFTDADSANAETPGKSGDGSGSTVELHGAALTILLRTDGDRLIYSCLVKGGILDELPETCVGLGKLERLGEIEEPDIPYTNDEEYVGMNLWAENDGTDIPPTVYVELPAGGFAEAVLVQP